MDGAMDSKQGLPIIPFAFQHRAFFATLDSRNRYAILYRLQDARKPETGAGRLEQYIAMLNERRKLYP
jgi:uncharacterized protein YdeI (YjbR/CyaY-like superfamily)